MHCSIYRSSKKEGMYLYVQRPQNSVTENQPEFDPLAVLPEVMRLPFGRAEFVMHLQLSETRKLARANVLHVMDSLQNNGFFIQMPPEGFINPTDVPEGLRGA